MKYRITPFKRIKVSAYGKDNEGKSTVTITFQDETSLVFTKAQIFEEFSNHELSESMRLQLIVLGGWMTPIVIK